MDIVQDFGKYKLNPETIDSLRQIDSACDNQEKMISDNTSLMYKLIKDVQTSNEVLRRCQNKNYQYFNKVYDELNDFTDGSAENLENITESKDIQQQGHVQDISSPIELTTNPYEKDEVNHNFVSNYNEDNEFQNLMKLWNEQITPVNKQNFIKEISLNIKNPQQILILIRKIICPWLLSEDTFIEAAETVIVILPALSEQLICEIFLPILKEKKSIMIKENSYLNDLISALNDSQRVTLLSSYLNEIATEMNEYDLVIIHILIESSVLSSEIIQHLLKLLIDNIQNINSSRYFGNTLLLIAQKLSSNTPKDILNLILSLCDQFKGVMRFRIKNILKTISVNSE